MKHSLFTRFIAAVMFVMTFIVAKTGAQNILADVIPTAYNVSPTGAFAYSVPLNLPPGIGELMPGLAISYNSQVGNGLLGVGWSLEGVSMITRGLPTIFHEANISPVDFNSNDVFFLDGQRLLNTAGPNYNTEIKNFAIIRAVPFNPAGNGPSHFMVEYPNGLIYEYGNSLSSKMFATGKTEVLMWAVNKITDPYGNYIEFNYVNDNTTGDYRIANIYYTGNSNTGTPASTEIIFEYTPRTDKNKLWVDGSQIRSDVVLDYIQVEHSGNFVKKYQFGYDLDDYSHLISIKEILPNSYELPEIVINWGTTATADFLETVSSTGTAGAVNLFTSGDYDGDGATDILKMVLSSSGPTPMSLHISDMQDNFVQEQSDDLFYGTAPAFVRNRLKQTTSGRLQFDYDGDGDDDIIAACRNYHLTTHPRMDFLLFTYDENQHKMVYQGYIMRFAQQNPGGGLDWLDYATITPGDYDGDGKTEILFGYPDMNSSGVISYDYYLVGDEYPTLNMNNAPYDDKNPIFKTGSWLNATTEHFAMDMDGDGKDEFVRTVVNSSHELHVFSFLFNYSPNPSLPSSPNMYPLHVNNYFNSYYNYFTGDFNGDGKQDILGWVKSNSLPGPQTGFWAIAYSKGKVFDAAGLPASLPLNVYGTSDPDRLSHYVADFNGDGKDDILELFDYGQPGFNMYYSLGDNEFKHETGSLPNIDVRPTKNLVGDFNGDGQADIMCHFNGVADPYIYYFHKNEDKHLVTSIDNGGHIIDVQHLSLPQGSINGEYTANGNNTGGNYGYPYVERAIPLKLVTAISDNIGQNKEYKYGNLIHNAYGLGLRGFMYLWETDIAKSKIAVSEYKVLDETRMPYPAKSEFWDLNTFNDVQNSTLPPFPATKPITMTETLMEDIDGGLSGKVVIPFSQDVHAYDFSKGTYTHTTLNGQNLNTGPGTAIYEFGLVPYIVTYSYYNQAINSASTEHFTYDMNAAFNIRAKPTRRQTVTSYNTTSYLRRTDFVYDSQGGVASVIRDPGTNNQLITDYTYDLYGNVATEIRTPFGATFPSLVGSYTYTPDGRFRETSTNVNNFTFQNQYDNVWGNVLQSSDENGLLTTYQYDENNRVTEVNTPTGMQTFYFYDWAINSFFNPTYTLDHENPRFLVTEQVVGIGASTLKFTDFYGRKIRGVTVAFDGSVLYQDNKYNAKGLLIESKEPYGTLNPSPVITTYIYDDMDRLISTSMSNNGPSSTISYTPLIPDMPPHGMETTVTTSGGVVKTTKTNAMGQMLRVEEGSNTIDYSYHANGKYLDIMVDGNMQLLTQYVYDAYGRATSVTEPNAGTTTYAYDPYDRMVSKTDANGTAHEYAYDQLGRLTQKREVPNNIYYYYNYGNPPGMNTTGKLMSTTSTTLGLTYDTYTYDQYGRMSSHTSGHTANYEYDIYNRLTKYEFRGDAYRKIYNQFGYLEEVTSDQLSCSPPAGPCFNYIQTLWRANAVNHRGQVTEAEYFNYQNTPIYREDKSYDAFGYITDHTVTNLVSSNVIYDYQYSFDVDNGNLDSRMDVLRSLTENFTYDSKERLTDVAYSNSLSPLQMTYDIDGNILKKSDVSTSVYDWKYNAYALTRVPEPQTSTPPHEIPINKQTVTYTPFRKAKSISEEVNRIDITYNPITEQRTKTEWFDINGNPSGILLKTKMYHDRCEISIDAVNNPNQCAVWSNYVDAYDDNIAIIERKTYSQSPFHTLDDTAIRFTITDHLGSLVMILDNAGLVNDGVLEERSFDAWGRTRDINTWQPDQVMQWGSGVQFNPGWMVDRGYTFHEHYWENGIINMNGRLYDPLVGRMFSPDPYIPDGTNSQDYNKYIYARNNPMKYIDPDGNFTILASNLFYEFQKIFSPIAIKANIPWGTHQRGIGFDVSLGFPGIGYRYHFGSTYYWKNYGDRRGWENREGSEVQFGGFTHSGTTFRSNGITQTTNMTTVGVLGANMKYENETAMFNWVPGVRNVDGGDRYRTAAAQIEVGPMVLGMNLHTGMAGVSDLGQPGYQTFEHATSGREWFTGGNIGDPAQSNGVVYFGTENFRIGWDNESNRHILQNRVAHDGFFGVFKRGQGRDYPWVLRLNRKPRFYFQMGSGSGNTLW